MGYVVVEGEFQAETPLAVCLELPGLQEEVWIPKSQILRWDDDAYGRGDPCEIEVKEWFAEKEGLI